MKPQSWMWRLRVAAALFLALAFAGGAAPALAGTATNTALGSIGGVDGDLGDSDPFTLEVESLRLIKRAFTEAGAPLASGASVPKGSRVQFMVYVNNYTDAPVSDIRIADALSAGPDGFDYLANTIRIGTTADCGSGGCNAGQEAALLAAAVTAQTDDPGAPDDFASYDGGTRTISAGSTANQQLDVAKNTVWAIVFTVTVQ